MSFDAYMGTAKVYKRPIKVNLDLAPTQDKL